MTNRADARAPDDDDAIALASLAAIVTGGASGIGAALVAALRARGTSVLAVDLDEQGLAQVAEATGCLTMFADVSSRAANSAAASRCVEKFGRLDLSFLNAGILDRSPAELSEPFGINDLDFDRYEKVRGVLLDAVIHGTAAAAEEMHGDGSVVVTASAAGLVPWHPTPIYSAMKHAVVGWTRAIAPALERDGVRINAICPGGIATPLLGLEPRPRSSSVLLSPRDVADAMIEIAMSDSSGGAYSIVAGREPMLQLQEFHTVPGFP